jgi:hypothetical protein
LQFSPQKIAAAAIYIAAAYLEIEVSAASAMRWDDLLGLSAYQLENISRQILRTYSVHVRRDSSMKDLRHLAPNS